MIALVVGFDPALCRVAAEFSRNILRVPRILVLPAAAECARFRFPGCELLPALDDRSRFELLAGRSVMENLPDGVSADAISECFLTWPGPGIGSLQWRILHLLRFRKARLWLVNARYEIIPLQEEAAARSDAAPKLATIRDAPELSSFVRGNDLSNFILAVAGHPLAAMAIRDFGVDPRRVSVIPTPGETGFVEKTESILDLLRGRMTSSGAPRSIPSVAEYAAAALGRRAARMLHGGSRKRKPAFPGISRILCYHRVATPADDPLLLAVSPDLFRKQMEFILSAGEIVPLENMITPGGDRPRFAVTFDDGADDNIRTAIPILRDLGIPATFFLVADAVCDGQPFWWDRLCARAARGFFREKIKISDREIGIDDAPGSALRRLFPILKRMPPIERENVLEKLGARGEDLSRPALVEDWKRASSKLVTIGCHSKTHASLGALNAGSLIAETFEARDALETNLGIPVETFAYPFGGPADLSLATAKTLQRAGFRLAVTTMDANVTSGGDPFFLPRLVVRNWPLEVFEERLFSPRPPDILVA